MLKQSHIIFSVLKRSLFVFFFLSSFFAYNQVKLDKKSDGISHSNQLKIAKLHQLIVTDIDLAENEITDFKGEIQQSKNSNLIIEISILEAEMYRSRGDYIHMKLAYYEALSWKTNQTHLYQKTLLKYLGAINEGIKGNKIKQEKLLLEVNQLAKKNNYKFIEAKANYSLGKFYSNELNFKKAKLHLDNAYNSFNSLNYIDLSFEAQVNKGINHFWEGNYDSALYYFHITKKYAFDNGLKKSYTNAILNLGEAHLFIEGNSDSAKYYFDIFLKYKNEADIRDIYHCYANLEEYYNLKNNRELAYQYSKMMIQVDYQIKDKMLFQTNSEIDRVYKRLQNEKKLTEDRNHENKLKIIFGLCGIFLLLVLIIILFVLKQKSKTNRVLHMFNDEIVKQKNVINNTLKEKELLLKEIHHRVKNNLQIISSLLSLQSNNIDNEKAELAIKQSKERIQAIALIHQKLYLDTSFASIEMNDYLTDLIKQLNDSYNEKQDKIKITLKTNQIVLNIDTVVPLGLIICELVTNAFKYAFTNKSDGTIKLEICKLEQDFYQLKIKDNGEGMNSDFSFLESHTLGVEIITALTEQLDGDISYKSDENGTSIKIKFKEVNA
ncbi:MAG: sensor histidine kinase [Bacteroidota bacterium]